MGTKDRVPRVQQSGFATEDEAETGEFLRRIYLQFAAAYRRQFGVLPSVTLRG